MGHVRKPFVGGNWKMNMTLQEVQKLVEMLNKNADSLSLQDTDVVVCPPFVYLMEVLNKLNRLIKVAAQNCHSADSGAYTGEVSASMLASINTNWVVLGHSERRNIFQEKSEWIAEKAVKAISCGLNVIFCVGEMLDDRENGNTEKVVTDQLTPLFALKPDWSKVVIAYEPVWAIGTGKTATPDQAQEVHRFIRNLLNNEYNENVAESVRIIYGGSVNAKNSEEIGRKSDVDGFLVGGASLKPDFIDIVKSLKA